MTIKGGHEWSAFIVMIFSLLFIYLFFLFIYLFFFIYFSGLSNMIMRQYIVAGDWSQSKVPLPNQRNTEDSTDIVPFHTVCLQKHQMSQPSENVPSDMCAQRRLGSACAFA